jgi:hypothetical protein
LHGFCHIPYKSNTFCANSCGERPKQWQQELKLISSSQEQLDLPKMMRPHMLH